MQSMRSELDGNQYIQDSVQHLTNELKSPITAIQAALELISPNMPPEDQARFLAQIKTQSNRVQTIIQNMLGLATLEHQQQLQHLTTVNLSDLVQTQITHLANKAAQNHVQFKFSPLNPIEIQADTFLLDQAIYNLLENALDFSPAYGEIIVATETNQAQIKLTICDRGSGISDYALDKVFDKFYSLHRPQNSQNAGQKSTGLGLNFVQEVVKLHSGSVTLGNIQLKSGSINGAVAVITLANA